LVEPNAGARLDLIIRQIQVRVLAGPSRTACKPQGFGCPAGRCRIRGPTGGDRANDGPSPPSHRSPRRPAPADWLARALRSPGRFAPRPGLGAGHASEGSSSDRTVPMGDRYDT
jgi:hypothetical protein